MRLRSLFFAVASVLLGITSSTTASAQLEPPSTGGAVTLDRELRMLGHDERVLMIGAHPDDEDTELLTVLVRGMGADAAYLSLNRGEGGQNLIGPELGEALGLLRSEELLAARRLDGARQYFTRAYDFGYSKTLDETWTHWPRDTILKDVVRIVRRFRPQIIVSVFSGTPRDGHGQHQAAGWAAMEAFRAAGDSTRFPELAREEGLAPWTPSKLYRSTRFDSTATTVVLEGGALDRAVGLSFHQIAMAGRSLHRSQDMGRLQALGPSRVPLALLEDRTGGGGDLFAGIDTTLQAASAAPAGRRRTSTRCSRFGGTGRRRRCRPRELAHLDRAIVAAAGVVCDARSDDDRVAPGQRLAVVIECWNTGPSARTVTASLARGRAMDADTTAATLRLAPGALVAKQVTATVARDAALTAPYFRLPGGDTAGVRLERGRALRARRAVRSAGALQPVRAGRHRGGRARGQLRLNDQARGEVRRPLAVVPRVDVALDPGTEVWPAGSRKARRFTVTLAHGASDTTTGTLTLELPAGWAAVTPQSFRLEHEDERETYTFDVRPPAAPVQGTVQVRAVARDASGRRYETGLVTVDYPHIRPRSLARPSAARCGWRSWLGRPSPGSATSAARRIVCPRR